MAATTSHGCQQSRPNDQFHPPGAAPSTEERPTSLVCAGRRWPPGAGCFFEDDSTFPPAVIFLRTLIPPNPQRGRPSWRASGGVGFDGGVVVLQRSPSGWSRLAGRCQLLAAARRARTREARSAPPGLGRPDFPRTNLTGACSIGFEENHPLNRGVCCPRHSRLGGPTHRP